MEAILEFIVQLLVGDGLIIAVGMFVLMQLLKPILPEDKRQFIPLGCGILGAALGFVLLQPLPVASAANAVSAIIKGAALGWAATGGYETVHQFIKARKEAAKE